MSLYLNRLGSLEILKEGRKIRKDPGVRADTFGNQPHSMMLCAHNGGSGRGAAATGERRGDLAACGERQHKMENNVERVVARGSGPGMVAMKGTMTAIGNSDGCQGGESALGV